MVSRSRLPANGSSVSLVSGISVLVPNQRTINSAPYISLSLLSSDNHHGWDNAAVLATRSTKDEAEGRGTTQSDVQKDLNPMIAMLEHLVIVAVMVCVLSTGCTNPVDEPQFKISTKRDNDKVDVKVERDKNIFSVHSPFGISQTVIERTHGTWADIVMLRLHLNGMENFNVSNGKVTLEASVSSQDGNVRLWKDGKEVSPLDSKSPYWTEIRMFGNDGKQATTTPLKDGYFEIQLPKALFEDSPKSITVNWIDFYR